MDQLKLEIVNKDDNTILPYVVPCASFNIHEDSTSADLKLFATSSRDEQMNTILSGLKSYYNATPDYYEIESNLPGYGFYYGPTVVGDIWNYTWKTDPTEKGNYTSFTRWYCANLSSKTFNVWSYILDEQPSASIDYINPIAWNLYHDYFTISCQLQNITIPTELIFLGKNQDKTSAFGSEDIDVIKQEIQSDGHLVVSSNLPDESFIWTTKGYTLKDMQQESNFDATTWLISSNYYSRIPFFHNESTPNEHLCQLEVNMNYSARYVIEGKNGNFSTILFRRPTNIYIDKLLYITNSSGAALTPSIINSQYDYQQLIGNFKPNDFLSYHLNNAVDGKIYGLSVSYFSTTLNIPNMNLWSHYSVGTTATSATATANKHILISDTNFRNWFNRLSFAFSAKGYPNNWKAFNLKTLPIGDGTTNTYPIMDYDFKVDTVTSNLTLPTKSFNNEYNVNICATRKSNPAMNYQGDNLVSKYQRIIINNGWVDFSISNSATNKTLTFTFNGMLPLLGIGESYDITAAFVPFDDSTGSRKTVNITNTILTNQTIDITVPASNRIGFIYFTITNQQTKEVISSWYINAANSYGTLSKTDGILVPTIDDQPLHTFTEFKEPIIQAYYSNKWKQAVAEDEYMTGARIFIVATNTNDIDVKMNYTYTQYQNNETELKKVTNTMFIQAHRCAVIDCSVSGIDSNDSFSINFSCDYTDRWDQHNSKWYTYNGYVGFSSGLTNISGSEEFTEETHETTV